MASSISEFLPEPISQNWCCTKREVTKVTFEWTISDFSCIVMKPGQYLESTEFSSNSTDSNDVKWFLKLYPNGETEDHRGFLSLYLNCCADRRHISAKYRVGILNSAQDMWFKITKLRTYQRTGISLPSWGFSEFIERFTLLNAIHGYLPDDKLQLYCEVNFYNDVSISGIKKANQQGTIFNQYQSTNFYKLFENRDLTDITLKVGVLEIQAHTAVLAAGSDVFYAMFKHDMTEKESYIVEITDVEYNPMYQLVSFLYSGKAPNLNECEKLLIAADKYNVVPLKAICESHLGCNLTIDNVAKCLILSDVHNAPKLKNLAIKFATFHAHDIIETPGWKILETQCPHIGTEVFRQCIKKRKLDDSLEVH